MLYILAVLSAEALANRVPVGLKAISNTSSSCSVKTFKHMPYLRSQSLTVLSKDEVAASSPENSKIALLNSY